MIKWLFLIVWCFLPLITNAAVYISEVAWMGDSESANYEWIELYNDGAAIDATGWVITDGMNLNINLDDAANTVIPAGTRVVLERTSEESSSAKAFLIYTGALVNSGATLKLQRADGSLVDQVSGGENWQSIGGDNTTKETAQYTTNGWVTAPATPGSGPQIEAKTQSVEENIEEENSTEPKISSSAGKLQKPKPIEPRILELPDITLELMITAPEYGYVNQPVNFVVEASGIGQTLIDSLSYEWNFGDGSVSNKDETEHVFQYPGTYVVYVYANYKRQEQVARHEITILPAKVSLTKNGTGDIQINNDSPYEIDISNYRLVSEREFIFPERSVVLPNQTVTISAKRLGDNGDQMVAVYDPANMLLASWLPSNLRSDDIEKTEPVVSQVSEVMNTNFSFKTETNEDDLPPVYSLTATTVQLASSESAGESQGKEPYLAMIAVLTIGAVGVLAVPRRNQNA